MRLSYLDWLRKKTDSKFLGNRENTPGSGVDFNTLMLKLNPHINYLFTDEKSAVQFVKDFKITRHYQSEEQAPFIVFEDKIAGKWAVIIDDKAHAKLMAQYDKEHPLTLAQCTAKLKIIKTVTATLAQSDFKERIDRIQVLVRRLADGGADYKVISAYHLMMLIYQALHMDSMNASHLAHFARVCNLLMEENNVGTGLKQKANWWDFVRNMLVDPKELITLGNAARAKDYAQTDAKHHVDGVQKRKVVDRTTRGLLKLMDPVLETDSKSASIDIPKFMGAGAAQEIIFGSGGMKGHFTVSRIWKEGLGADFKPSPAGKAPVFYKYYYTVHNAGAGLRWKDESLGIAYATATYELNIAAKPSDANYESIAREAIIALMQAERMITLYKAPRGVSDSKTESYCEPESAEAKAWQYWDEIIQRSKGNFVAEKSCVGDAQLTGNCTAMSQKWFLKGVPQSGNSSQFDPDLSTLLEEVWFFAKQNGVKEISEKLTAEATRLDKLLADQTSAAALSVVTTDGKLVPVVSAAHSSSTVAVDQKSIDGTTFFAGLRKITTMSEAFAVVKQVQSDPRLLDLKSPDQHQSTALISAIILAGEAKSNDVGMTYIKVITELLKFPQNFSTQDAKKCTALHRAVFYAEKTANPAVKAKLRTIAITLVENGVDCQIRNVHQATAMDDSKEFHKWLTYCYPLKADPNCKGQNLDTKSSGYRHACLEYRDPYYKSLIKDLTKQAVICSTKASSPDANDAKSHNSSAATAASGLLPT